MTCPVCKSENNQGAKFCQECSIRLEFQCPYCQAPSAAGAKFCSECGSNLDFRCLQCGSVSRPGAKFCQQCGVRLVTLCFQCQTPTPPGAKFCQECSARLERRCTQCGTPILYAAKYCNGCGTPLLTAVAGAPAFLEAPVAPQPVIAAPPREVPATAPPTIPTTAGPAIVAPPVPPEEVLLEPVSGVVTPEAPIAATPEVSQQVAPPTPSAPLSEPSAPAAPREPVAPAAATALPPPAPTEPVTTDAVALRQDERRLVTVLFGDVSGFTAMSEKLDPEEVKQIMDRCLKMLADQVFKFEGTVDKFAGDNIMAVWGAPVAHEDDAERAVLAALDMQAALAEFAKDLQRRRGFDLKMRIGLNTGEVVSGAVAAGREKDYTVMGDVVNTASRFEHGATPGHVMVGEKTYGLTKHLIEYEELEPIMVKGKSEPLQVYDALGVKEERGRRRGLAGVDVPMVGRGHEVEALLESFHETVADQTPHLVAILGIPGLGKSRLLNEFQRYLDTENLSFAWCKGRCLPYGQGIAFYPLAEMLKGSFSIKESDAKEIVQQRLLEGVQDILQQAARGTSSPDAMAEEARQIAHRLGYAIGISFPDSDLQAINPTNVKEELFWAWRRLFARWASILPLIIVVEDAHWADKLVLDLLQSVITSLEGVPILFLCVGRPELLEEAPDLTQGPNRRVAELSPLTSEETVELLDRLLSPNLLSRAWKERMVSAAGGIPFFLEEYIRTLTEEGRLVQGPAGWTPVEAEQLPALPDTIFSTLFARMDRLPSMEKAVLQRSAVVGNSFWDSSLSYPAPHLASESVALQGLLVKDWIKEAPTSSFENDPEYLFTNGLIRESAYKGLTRLRRSQEHQRVAGWLEAKVADRLEEFLELLAYHYGQGSLQEFSSDSADEQPLIKAVSYGWRAAERARLQQTYADALTRYNDTLELLQRLAGLQGPEDLTLEDQPLWRLELQTLLERSRVKEPLGLHDSALEDLATLLEEAVAMQCQPLEADANAQKARVLRLKGQPNEAVTCAEHAIQLYEQTLDRSGKARALMILGELYSDQAKLAEFEAVCREACDLAKESGPRWLEARGLTLLGSACIYQGKMEAAEAHLKVAVQTYQEIMDRRGLASGLLMLGRVLHGDGQSAEAIETIERAFAIFDELGDLPMRAATLATLGQLCLERGDLAASRRHSERGVALAKTVGQAAQQARCLLLLAQAEIAAGQAGEALSPLLEAKDLCEQSEQRAILPEVYRMLALAYLGAGQPETGEQYALLGRQVVEEGDRYSQGTTWLALAEVLAGLDRREEAEAAFAHALEDLEASGENYEIGEAHLAYSSFLLGSEESTRAQEHLDQAHEAFAPLETRDKLDRIAVLQAQLQS